MKNLNRIIAAALIFANCFVLAFPVLAQANKLAQNAKSRAASKTPGKTTPAVFENPELVKEYQKTIAPESLASRLYFLASDFFEGRETGARGQRMAAQYLASQYRLLGLEPNELLSRLINFLPKLIFSRLSFIAKRRRKRGWKFQPAAIKKRRAFFRRKRAAICSTFYPAARAARAAARSSPVTESPSKIGLE